MSHLVIKYSDLVNNTKQGELAREMFQEYINSRAQFYGEIFFNPTRKIIERGEAGRVENASR